MKTLKYLFPALIGVALVFTACKKEEAVESCDADDYADDFQCSAPAVATFCLGGDDSQPSYYTYNGENYFCTGAHPSTCTDALTQMSAAMKSTAGCSVKSEAIDIQLSDMAELLLLKVQTQSLCD